MARAGRPAALPPWRLRLLAVLLAAAALAAQAAAAGKSAGGGGGARVAALPPRWRVAAPDAARGALVPTPAGLARLASYDEVRPARNGPTWAVLLRARAHALLCDR
jgi:hypothetical protein